MNRSLRPLRKILRVMLTVILTVGPAHTMGCIFNGGGSSPTSTQRCFRSSSDTFTGWLEWRENKEGQITGELLGQIRQSSPAYAADYLTHFVGTPTGATAQTPRKYNVRTSTTIDGQLREREETWLYSGNTVQTGAQLFERADCDDRP